MAEPPARISHYRIESLLGQGGMGIVYLAEDQVLHRRVALKVLAPKLARDPDARRRFVNEGRASATLNHPNAAVLYEVGTEGDDLNVASSNGAPRDFTHSLEPFVLEGITFRRRKVDPAAWADVLERTGTAEREAIGENRVTLKVSAEGLNELIVLAIVEEQHGDWNGLREAGMIEWGELVAIREWLWEQMTDRPFSTDTPSSPGPGEIEASSEGGSRSKAGTRKG